MKKIQFNPFASLYCKSAKAKQFFLCFTVLLLQHFTYAQVYKQWAKNFGGSNSDIGHSIQQTSDGGYVLLGGSQSNYGDFTQNNGDSDYGVIKIDASGNKQWSKNFGGSNYDGGQSIQQTSDGGYILLGVSQSNNGDFSQNNGAYDYGVIKIDASGNKQWSKNFGGSNDDAGQSIQQTSDGGYILLGFSSSNNGDFTQNNGSSDYGIIKIDAAGNKQWTKKFGGSGSDEGYSIQQTTDGGYVLFGGSYSSNGDFTQNNGYYDYGVIKIDMLGNKQWSKNLGGINYDAGQSIQQTSDGGYVLFGGSYSSNGDFTQNNGNYDYGVIKIAPCASFAITATPTAASCANNYQGSISLSSAAASLAGYSYNYNGGAAITGNGTTIPNLAAGTYSITATDANGCASTPISATVGTSSAILVTNTNDSGSGSLREAINCSNGHIGADTILFNISGSGQKVITLASALPALIDAGTVIDGGAWINTSTPSVKLINYAIGTAINSNNNVIKNMEFDKTQITIYDNNFKFSNNIVRNWTSNLNDCAFQNFGINVSVLGNKFYQNQNAIYSTGSIQSISNNIFENTTS